jgi:alpha-L-arabinofuranosidase
METLKLKLASATLILAVAVATGASPTASLTVQADQPGAAINPAMWGIFFEDINFGADGGLYAELVKNRSFEFPDPLMGWFKISPSHARGDVAVRHEEPFHPANPNYLRIRSEASAPLGVSNPGFRGMGVRAGESYDFSAQVRRVAGAAAVLIELVANDGDTLAEARLGELSPGWRKVSVTLQPKETDAHARLNVLLEGQGTVDFDMVSLFPQKTWKNRSGGLRADMVQMLADLKPGFMRFPGGCIVEGSDLAKRYQWKTTIGPVEERKLLINRWNYEFKHRPAPDYFQSFGLGFFEFFLLCEDLGAEPLPILNCGMACQFNSGELVSLGQLDPYVQDAVDLIEFANGPATSTWGAKRAAMGHPAPFKMKLLGIGNEQWGAQYIERYAAFAKVLKAKHPEITLVSSAGPAPADERFEFLWPKLRALKADVVDEHCYANPVWFFTSANRFDTYDRRGPKVFFGEYAAQSDKIVSVENQNNWECALSEAAFMTGMERNAEVVRLASYAPLFGHEEGWQWRPNLIWADNLRVYGTPNYYVQQAFSHNRGDQVLPTKLVTPDLAPAASGGIGLGTFQTAVEFKDVRIVRGGEVLLAGDFLRGTKDWTLPREGGWEAKGGVLSQSNPRATSTIWAGNSAWTDYTVSLKARKLGGSEGFIVIVRNDPPNTRVQWNVGGWGNTRHGIQSSLGVQDSLIAQTPGAIDPGRWYDVRIELQGPRMDCFLDGKRIQSAAIPVPRRGGFFASAVRDNQAGEVVLKLVNAAPEPCTADIHLAGVSAVKPGAKATLLTSDSLADVNSLDAPAKVSPIDVPQAITAPRFSQTVPANALLVLRVPVTN